MFGQGVCGAGGQEGLSDPRTQLVEHVFVAHDRQPPPAPKLCSTLLVIGMKCTSLIFTWCSVHMVDMVSCRFVFRRFILLENVGALLSPKMRPLMMYLVEDNLSTQTPAAVIRVLVYAGGRKARHEADLLHGEWEDDWRPSAAPKIGGGVFCFHPAPLIQT